MESTTEVTVEPASSGLFSHFLSILSSIGTIWTFLLVLLICFDVIARSFFNKPIAGVTEIAGASLIAIVYLNIASSINSRRLTRADILIDVMGMRWPRLRSGIEAVFDIIGLLVFSLIAKAGAREALESFHERDYFGIEGVFTLVHDVPGHLEGSPSTSRSMGPGASKKAGKREGANATSRQRHSRGRIVCGHQAQVRFCHGVISCG